MEDPVRRGVGRPPDMIYELDGETLTLAEWARRLDVPVSTIWRRLKSDWDVRRALTEPPRGRQTDGKD